MKNYRVVKRVVRSPELTFGYVVQIPKYYLFGFIKVWKDLYFKDQWNNIDKITYSLAFSKYESECEKFIITHKQKVLEEYNNNKERQELEKQIKNWK